MTTPAPGRLRGLVLDTTPLRENPPFRRLWIGEAVSTLGSQMTLVAIPLHVFALTRSSLAVGLIGLASFVPLLLLALYGGAVADAMERRGLLLRAELALMACTLALVAHAALDVRAVWPLYVVAGCTSGLSAVASPTRRAVWAALLRPDQLAAASALNQVMFTGAVILGPLVAGLITGHLGYEWAYGVDAVSFLASLAMVLTLPSLPPEGGGTKAGLASVVEGLRYLRTRRVLLSTFVVDLNAMVFGMPRALFPAIAATRFGAGEEVAGLLYASPAFGAFLAALLSGWSSRIRRQGLAVMLAVLAWGLAIVGFGLAPWLWLCVLMLALAGAADMVSAVFRNVILQAETPDAMRGRLYGVHFAVVAGGPRLGDLEAGTVAAATSPAFSVVSGGLACVAGVFVLAAAIPSFVRYQPPPEVLGAADPDDGPEPYDVPEAEGVP